MKKALDNVLRGELIGLRAHILESRDPTHVSLCGEIIGESKETILLQHTDGVVRLPKAVCVFEITTPDSSRVSIEGTLLRGRPEERLKKMTRRW